VFLTISGKTAKNPDAFATTFVEFTLRTMSALEASGGAMPAADVRFAFSMLFTHFLTAAVPVGVDLRRVIQLFDNWESRLTDIKFLEKHMNEIAESMNALPLEVRHG
jgi:hypothetical protein